MSIVYTDDSGITFWPLTDLHDVQSQKYYYIDYRPDFWQANWTYVKGLDLIIPTVPNGCMYECLSGGKSSAVSPTFTTEEGKTVTDNDVKWRTIPFSAKLGYDDYISDSEWSAPIGVNIGNAGISGGKTTFVKVTGVDSSFTEFDLVNIIQVVRISGRVEVFKKTLRVTTGEL
jgi:hypothetical protein